MWYGLSSIFGRLLNYLLTPVLTAIFLEEDYGKISVLFTIAAGCHLLLAFHLVAKLRNRGAGMPAAGTGTSAVRIAISFVLFWVAFALALGLHDAPAGSAFPSIYAIYCGAMLALLLAAFFGAWLLGRLVRQRSQANPPPRRIL